MSKQTLIVAGKKNDMTTVRVTVWQGASEADSVRPFSKQLTVKKQGVSKPQLMNQVFGFVRDRLAKDFE